MKKISTILLILFIGIFKVYSCECSSSNLKNEILNSDLIFQGKVIAKEKVDYKWIYTFKTEKVWKGINHDTIKIKTNVGGEPACEMIFEMGKTYVVFSSKGETDICKRNSLIENTFDGLKLDYKFNTDLSSTSFVNANRVLNKNEANYLSLQFPDLAKIYNFTQQRVLFTSNTKVITKKEWYEKFWEYEKPSKQLIILTEKEKEEYGYDTILVTYCKKQITDKMKRKILKQIN